MKLSKQKRNLESALEKLKRSQDFNSDCKLTSEESTVIYVLLTTTAVKISQITNGD